MEMYVFFATIGMLIALIFVAIGVSIGKADDYFNQKRDKSHTGLLCKGDTDIRIYHRGDYHKFDRVVGNIYGEIDRGRDMGCYHEGRITPGCAKVALEGLRREMKTMLTGTEEDAIVFAVNLINDKYSEYESDTSVAEVFEAMNMSMDKLRGLRGLKLK